MSAPIPLDTVERFEFGANWFRFLAVVNERRIREARESLQQMLGTVTLQGKSFLDIGSGSGLFSLAARQLGARVRSFDFDRQSVECTRELRRRYCADDPEWQVEQGSILDRAYLASLGQFDVVYSWGVLHHTGAMWLAIENALTRVAPGGTLFIAIYNDQGTKSRLWWLVKRTYNRLPRLCRPAFVTLLTIIASSLAILKHTLRLKPMTAIAPLLQARRDRGMSARYDWTDWVGGFPFEFASFDLLQQYFEARGLVLMNSRRTLGWGCNELVLQRKTCAA